MNESLLQPIPGDSEVGYDAKYDDLYVLIEAEIDKLDGLDPNSVAWKSIRDNAYLVLKEKSKDIKIALWMVYALSKTNSSNSMIDAIDPLCRLIEGYGANLYPHSPKARSSAFIRFESLITKELVREGSLSIDHTIAASLQKNLIRLKGLIHSHLAINETLFQPLLRLLEEKNRSVPAPEAQINISVGVDNTEIRRDIDIENDSSATNILNDIKKRAELLSKYWRSKSFCDVRSLRIARFLSWMDVEDAPPSENGKTFLNPPSKERVETIESLIQEGKISDAVELIETILIRSPFWFWGHQKLYDILHSAGKSSEAALVKESAAAMLRTYPNLMESKFRDGTPFVPSKLKSLFVAESHSAATESEDDILIKTGELCYDLLKSKEGKKAMDTLQSAYAGSTSGEEGFRWRLLHAKVAIDAMKPQIALALIDDLEADIDRYRLDEWRPDLAASAYTLTLQSFNRTQIERERYDRIFNRLCKLDPAAAMDIK